MVGNALLVQAIRLTDLSVLGPVNSYKAVVSLLPGLILLGELPSPPTLAGVALILAGSYGLVEKTGGLAAARLARLFRDGGVQYRLAAPVLSAAEAVFLKRAVLAASPLVTFAGWCMLGPVAAAPLLLLDRRGSAEQARVVRRSAVGFVWLAVTIGLMQSATLVTLAGLPVAAALALFQTSALAAVLLGWRVLREPAGGRRLAGALVMAAGAALVVLAW